MSVDLIYTNGDSFVAGVELADDFLPKYPGTLDWPWPSPKDGFDGITSEDLYRETKHEQAKQWLKKTYTPGHRFEELRNARAPMILKLEYERAFPSILQSRTGIKVINMAIGGASMDRIVRKTMSDLITLKKDHENIVAIIGTTHCFRYEMSSDQQLSENFLGEHTAWQCLSTGYRLPYQDYSNVEKVLDYKLMYEDRYHSVINFLKNVIMLQDFCKVNNITLYWVSTNVDITDDIDVIGHKYRKLSDLKNFIEYANFTHAVYMRDIAQEIKEGVLCPSGHYSQIVHQKTADQLYNILKDNHL